MQQQPARHVAGIPARPVERLMVAAKARLVRQPHDTQCLGDGALAGCHHGAGDQHQDVAPDRCGEARAEHRNRGYTLYDTGSGAPVARLLPTGAVHIRFEVLYWSLWKERWAATGPF